jgi:predicted GIY-YIG superfamily endonuclease
MNCVVGPDLEFSVSVPTPKRFVYILKSIRSPGQYYVGATSDPTSRLEAHNAGLSSHTARHRPWRNLVVIEFDEEEPALRFERYLKTGSGREFARRHFRQSIEAP